MELANSLIVLENDIVKLEPLQFDKHNAAFANFAVQQPTTWQYSLVSPGGSVQAMEKYINDAIIDKEKNIAYPFAIIHKATNTIVGCTRYYDIDFNNKNLSIGYTWYDANCRRNGINRNCKLLLLDYAFNILQMLRVEFRADINNAASIAAMKAIGCKEEGMLRSHAALPNGTRRTSIILSILKDEWDNGGRAFLLSKIY
jgi:N-acetyltransferase